MRVVLDTNVVASAMLWGGSPLLLLLAARKKRITLYSSAPLLAELADILARPKFERKIAASMLTVDQLVARYSSLVSVVRPALILPTSTDPDDDEVLAAAYTAHADMIVSGDRKHLLVLGKFEGIPILTVVLALAKIEETTATS